MWHFGMRFRPPPGIPRTPLCSWLAAPHVETIYCVPWWPGFPPERLLRLAERGGRIRVRSSKASSGATCGSKAGPDRAPATERRGRRGRRRARAGASLPLERRGRLPVRVPETGSPGLPPGVFVSPGLARRPPIRTRASSPRAPLPRRGPPRVSTGPGRRPRRPGRGARAVTDGAWSAPGPAPASPGPRGVAAAVLYPPRTARPRH